MKQYVEVEYRELEQFGNYDEFVNNVIAKCFEVENLDKTKLYVSIILTVPSVIRMLNYEFRKVDKETDVLSFPMF